jgi:hypothetical protein
MVVGCRGRVKFAVAVEFQPKSKTDDVEADIAAKVHWPSEPLKSASTASV